MKKVFYIILSLCFISIASAQKIHFLSGGSPIGAIYTGDTLVGKDIIVLNTNFGNSSLNNSLIKLDTVGNILWQKSSISSLSDSASYSTIASSSDSGFFFVTMLNKNPPYTRLSKISTQGNLLWARDIKTSAPSDPMGLLAGDKHGGIVVGGGGCSGAYLLRFDSVGNLLWQRSYQFTNMLSAAHSVLTKTKDGNFIALGYMQDFQYRGSLFLHKVNISGVDMWARKINLIDSLYRPVSLKEDAYGNIYTIMYQIASGSVWNDVLLKFDTAGNLIYSKAFLGTNINLCDITFDIDNNPIVVGNNVDSIYYGLYLKLNANNGNFIHALKIKSTDTSSNSIAVWYYMAKQIRPGKYFIAGDDNGSFVNIMNNDYLDFCIKDSCVMYPVALNVSDSVLASGNMTLGFNIISANYSLPNTSYTVQKLCSSTVGLEKFESVHDNVSIYPNPNNGSFVVEPQNTLYNVHCTVYDVNGREVLTKSINGKTTIDASSLNEGVYNISLQSNEGVVNKRLVIVR